MKTYHIITIGCQMNKSDSERLAGVLEARGYKWTGNKYKADLVAVNTCGVRQSAEDRVYGIIPRVKRENPGCRIIVTGCLAGREDVQRRLNGSVDKFLPISKIFNFQFSIFNKILNSNPAEAGQKGGQVGRILDSRFRRNDKKELYAYVPIGNGCNNFCSYCVVPYARGREVWRAAHEILADVRGLAERGYKEIILIAQNVNSYKSRNAKRITRNAKTINFADLLKRVNEIKGNFKIKFATSHPKDMTDELIRAVAECEKVVKEIHLPAQSGDNEILKKMNRRYTVEHYKTLIEKIRLAMPDAKITTDVIVGFPGETKQQFNNTVKLFKEVKFANAYIARYSPRPGTAAAKLADDVPAAEKKRRWRELSEYVNKKLSTKDFGGFGSDFQR